MTSYQFDFRATNKHRELKRLVIGDPRENTISSSDLVEVSQVPSHILDVRPLIYT